MKAIQNVQLAAAKQVELANALEQAAQNGRLVEVVSITEQMVGEAVRTLRNVADCDNSLAGTMVESIITMLANIVDSAAPAYSAYSDKKALTPNTKEKKNDARAS